MQQYSEEFKEQVLAEVDQVGNAVLVGRQARAMSRSDGKPTTAKH